MGIKYYICDTETNGLRAANRFHEVLEIGIIDYDTKVHLYENIKCEQISNSSFDALKITGKTLADLEKGKLKEEVVEKVMRFFEQDGLTPAHRCIVGHNIIPFDKKFLHALWESCGIAFPANLWLDTISLTQEYIKKSDPNTLNITKTATGRISKTLHAACDMLNIKRLSKAHDASNDSKNNYLLFKRLMEEGIDHLPHIKTFIHSFEIQPSVDDLLKELGDIEAD